MRPLPLLALGLAAGCAVYPWLQPPPAQAGAAAALVLLLALRRAWVLAAAGLLLGLTLSATHPVGPVLRGDWRLRGTVVSAPAGSESVVDVSSGWPLGAFGPRVRGPVAVRFRDGPPPLGSRVVVEGTALPYPLTRLPEAPDPAVATTRTGVRTLLRTRDVHLIGASRPAVRTDGAPNAALLAGLVRGDRAALSDDTATLLRRTGTWHLVSVSGTHVAFVAAAMSGLVWLLLRVPRLLSVRWAPPAAPWMGAAGVATAVAYAWWAGFPLPAQRAAWTIAGLAIARAQARRPSGWDVLALAAVGTLAGEPSAVGSISFQLSFAAVVGAALWTPRLLRWVPPDLAPWLVRVLTLLGGSVGATVGTLPLVAWHFGVLPRWGVFANLWAIPWLGVIATPLAMLGQVLPGSPGTLALAFADAAVQVGLAGLRLFDGTPIDVAVGPSAALGLAGAVLLARRPVLAALLSAVCLWQRRTVPDALRLTFFAVGQGDATLVEWPDGRRWLVDGGPPGTDLAGTLRRMGIHHLDEVVLTHAHPDHYGGLVDVFATLQVDTFRAHHRPAELAGLSVPPPPAWEPGVEVLGPPPPDAREENDNSVVLRLCAGGHCAFLPGDAEAPEEARLPALPAELLKSPHHGSRTSSTPAFVDAVAPKVVVICVGVDNRYGHPSPITLAHYRGASVYRTDRDGSVEVTLADGGPFVRRIAAPDRELAP